MGKEHFGQVSIALDVFLKLIEDFGFAFSGISGAIDNVEAIRVECLGLDNPLVNYTMKLTFDSKDQ